MFSLQNKHRLVKKSENLKKYGPFFLSFSPLPVMLKFTDFPVTRNVKIRDEKVQDWSEFPDWALAYYLYNVS